MNKYYSFIIFLLSFCFSSIHAQYSVIIDAGHGGKDNGTVGALCVEKDITLAIAKLLEKKIKRSPILTARMTRESDIFLYLSERSSLANAEKADLFISIHCNHIHIPSIKGTEIYVMGISENNEHLDIVKRENHQYEEETVLADDDADHIMQSFFQKSYLAESLKFGTYLEQEFITHTTLLSRGIRQAEFRVLKNTTMPGVLIEMAYLSNSEDEQYIMSDDGQAQIAESIYQSIYKYFTSTDYVKSE